MRLEMDDAVLEDDFLFGAVSNTISVGGVLTLDPKQVDMTDGKFELLLVRAPKDLMELSECIRAVQTQHYNCAMITFRSAQRVHAICQPEMPWTLDGERAECNGEVEIQNIHHAIRLMKKG